MSDAGMSSLFLLGGVLGIFWTLGYTLQALRLRSRYQRAVGWNSRERDVAQFVERRERGGIFASGSRLERQKPDSAPTPRMRIQFHPDVIPPPPAAVRLCTPAPPVARVSLQLSGHGNTCDLRSLSNPLQLLQHPVVSLA